jgi:hypothetical protein
VFDSDCELLRSFAENQIITRPADDPDTIAEFDKFVQHVYQLTSRGLVSMRPNRPMSEGEVSGKYKAVGAVLTPRGQKYLEEQCR